jgi:1,4-alpha-glucan branching enzyme
VHGKGSLLSKMPGDEWQRFANLRLLFAYMFVQPGKKLLFMGDEFGQVAEWHHDVSLDWSLTAGAFHAGVQRLVSDLNGVYRREPALHQRDTEPGGFEWIAGNDTEQSVYAFLRLGHACAPIVAVCNFTPVVRHGYRVGVPHAGRYAELVNSDAHCYGGSDAGNGGSVRAEAEACHGRPYSLSLTLPPLAALILKCVEPTPP